MKKEGEKIAMLTSYDYTLASIIDKAGIDVILVGDSASNVMAGHETTVPITLDQMIYHASSDIRVLYTLIRPGSDIETEPEFVLFPGYDNNVNRGVSTLVNSDGEILNNTYENSSRNTGNPDEIVPASVDGQFLEYQYTADNLGEFTGYAIKIVMSGTNQAETPKIRELRTIAIK